MIENNIFYLRLQQAIIESGKSANQIERELGYSRNALHNYKMGAEPSSKRLIELAQYFEVSPEYLMGAESDRTYDNIQEVFDSFTEQQKAEMMKVIQDWSYKKLFDTNRLELIANKLTINQTTKDINTQSPSLRSSGYTCGNFWWGTRYYFRSNAVVYAMDHDLDNWSIMSGVTALWAPVVAVPGAAYFQKVKSDLDYYNNTHSISDRMHVINIGA